MDFGVFDNPRPDVDPAQAARIAVEVYGISGTAEPLWGERDRSFKISGGSGDFVLKVGNRADRADALEGQSAAVEWALTDDPDLPVAGVIPTVVGTLTGYHNGHALQLSPFIAGARPPESNTSAGLRRSLGTLAARLSKALRGFDHPTLHRSFPWTLAQLPELAPLLEHVAADRRPLVAATLDRFEERVAPVLESLPRQATHGDLNPDNLVVDPADPERIVGVFDFGDLSWSPRAVETAVASAYQCPGVDPVLATAQVVSAFNVEDPLRPDEIEIMLDLVAARCAQSLLMSARHVATNAANRQYVTSDDEQMWDTLTRLDAVDGPEAVSRIAAACGFRRGDDQPLEVALSLRARRLGPSLHLSYDEPVHLSRGEGMWLIDADGNRLLDAYNNVPHVGHCHPEVVSALSRQAVLLSTNTRYLVDGVAEYADRLVGLMPDPLSMVLFVNSGSEANDLAYRIARTVTGNRGVITTANAYHGATSFAAAISPEEARNADQESWTAVVGGADLLIDAAAADRLRSDLDAARGDLEDRQEAPAMVILDTVFSSDGIFEVPPGLLAAARTWTEATGSLLVADEVQAGFGRVGHRFWGFAADGAVPDIVTLGKPMGNGYPMGAVVTSEAIAAKFASRSYFFSTFAGSPVAAAAGTAVLDVIESEDLAANADFVGTYLKRQVEALGLEQVVDVRGPGLFVGVELRSADLTMSAVNDLRRRGVLIASTGPKGTVLKIRPPLVCTPRHADIIVGALRASLGAG
jgi:4-aminobutyrate aminotransferase-like enzyme/Ser/Thr protein kinase RdoA (MazF antagonist)